MKGVPPCPSDPGSPDGPRIGATGGCLIAARHAPARLQGVCYGQSEIPTALDPETAAQTIFCTLPAGIAIHEVWTTSFTRCLYPARILARTLAAQLRVDERVRELDFGHWEGQPWDLIQQQSPDLLQTWSDDWYVTFPPGGESAAGLEQRMGAWWKELDRKRNHLLVAHAGAIRAMRVIALGRSWERAMQTPVEYLQAERFAFPEP